MCESEKHCFPPQLNPHGSFRKTRREKDSTSSWMKCIQVYTHTHTKRVSAMTHIPADCSDTRDNPGDRTGTLTGNQCVSSLPLSLHTPSSSSSSPSSPPASQSEGHNSSSSFTETLTVGRNTHSAADRGSQPQHTHTHTLGCRTGLQLPTHTLLSLSESKPFLSALGGKGTVVAMAMSELESSHSVSIKEEEMRVDCRAGTS